MPPLQQRICRGYAARLLSAPETAPGAWRENASRSPIYRNPTLVMRQIKMGGRASLTSARLGLMRHKAEDAGRGFAAAVRVKRRICTFRRTPSAVVVLLLADDAASDNVDRLAPGLSAGADLVVVRVSQQFFRIGSELERPATWGKAQSDPARILHRRSLQPALLDQRVHVAQPTFERG